MDLGDRCRRQRLRVEGGKQLADGLAQRVLDDRASDLCIEWRNAILQLGQFIGDVARQKITTCGQHLAELHEDRPELLECESQTFRLRTTLLAMKPRCR